MATHHVNGISLGVHEFGKRTDRTLVFAPPLLWDATYFTAMIGDLSRDFHVVALDLHGHGESGYRRHMTLEGMTEDLHALLSKLNLDQVAWLGCSVGGMIGMRMALAHPQSISSLLLMCTTARLDPPEIKAATSKLWDLFLDGHRDDIADAALTYFFAHKTFRNNPAMIARHRQALLEFTEVQGMYEAAQAAFERVSIGDAIKRIHVPTLVIAGSDDVTAPPAQAQFIAAQIPTARIEIIPDANHLVAIEQPATIAALVRAALQQRAHEAQDAVE